MARKQEEILSTKKGGATEMTKYKRLHRSFGDLVSDIGDATLTALQNLYEGEKRLSARIANRFGPILKGSLTAVDGFFRARGREIAHPFIKAKRGFRLIRQSRREAKAAGQSAAKAGWRTLCAGLARNGWFFKGLLNYGAATFGVLLAVFVIGGTTRLHLAMAVEYQGESLGYIESESVYTEASKLLQQRFMDESELQLSTPIFTLAVVGGDALSDEDALVNRMIRTADAEIVESNGVYIDGEFYGAVVDPTEIQNMVEAMLAKYRTGAAGEVVELTKPVEIRQGLFLSESVIDPDKILTLLRSEVAGEVTYTVKAGDTPSGIAAKNGISYTEFLSLNPDCEKTFLVGQTVYLSKSEPFMQVQVTRRETYRQEVMFGTQTINDGSKSTSYTAVIQNGKKGQNEITADVQYINGVEVGRTVLQTKILQKPVTQKIVKGTRIPSGASGSALNGSGSALGNLHFIWPVAGGEISSHYGYRWGTIHGGLDIRAPRGTAVYAAESGTVELSRWYSGYGYCVIINHGGGVKTLYGHASQLVAKQGQQVNKGDVIMLVGMTGQATGNHLHFEIRTNGTRINPLPYIGR